MKFIISLAIVISVVFATFWALDWYEQKQLENYNTGGPTASRMKPQAIPEVKLADISQIPFSNMDWRLKKKGNQYRQEGDWVTYHAHQLSKCKQGSIGRCYDLAIHDHSLGLMDSLISVTNVPANGHQLFRFALVMSTIGNWIAQIPLLVLISCGDSKRT